MSKGEEGEEEKGEEGEKLLHGELEKINRAAEYGLPFFLIKN